MDIENGFELPFRAFFPDFFCNFAKECFVVNATAQQRTGKKVYKSTKAMVLSRFFQSSDN